MDIGFRDYEFQNRLYLGRALGAASIKDNPMAIPLSEHIFSLTAKNHQSKVKKEIKNNNVTFSWNHKELFKYDQDVVNIKSPYKEGFIRFLRYHLGGHPKIIMNLQQLSGIPSSLTMTSHNVQTKITTLRLKSHKYISDKSLNLNKFTKGKVEGALASLFSENTIFSEDALNTSVNALLAKAMSAFNDKRYLDTILTYLEYTLATGKQMPKQFKPQRELITADLNVKAFLASIRPKSKEEAQKAVKTLVALRSKSKDRIHILKIFEANIRSSLGMQKKSIQLFHETLKKNPYITGAWKDLGELYFRSYNSRDAWRCWDAARKLNPRHKLLAKVTQFEVRLKKDNPDFF
jgi:tetratricopeptide (TPR) repeat protein